MNQNVTRFIMRIEPDGQGGYDWSVQYAPAAGHGAKRTVSGHKVERKSAIAAAIREAGTLSKVTLEGTTDEQAESARTGQEAAEHHGREG